MNKPTREPFFNQVVCAISNGMVEKLMEENEGFKQHKDTLKTDFKILLCSEHPEVLLRTQERIRSTLGDMLAKSIQELF